MAEWADRIVAVRSKFGLTKTAFVDLLNTSYLTLHRWERGELPESECPGKLIQLLENNPEEGLQILLDRKERAALMSHPFGEPESWGERIKRLRTTLGFTQVELAELIGVTKLSISVWENEKTAPGGCSEIMIDLLEYDFDRAAPLLWPDLLSWRSIEEPWRERILPEVSLEQEEGEGGEELGLLDPSWPPERIEVLRRNLRLSKINLSRLLHARSQTAYSWESGKASPGPCARILLHLLETYGSSLAEIISSIPPDDEIWPSERVINVRKGIGFERAEMADVFGIEYSILKEWEQRGFRKAGCHKLLYTLLEWKPEYMTELLRGLPRGDFN